MRYCTISCALVAVALAGCSSLKMPGWTHLGSKKSSASSALAGNSSTIKPVAPAAPQIAAGTLVAPGLATQPVNQVAANMPVYPGTTYPVTPYPPATVPAAVPAAVPAGYPAAAGGVAYGQPVPPAGMAMPAAPPAGAPPLTANPYPPAATGDAYNNGGSGTYLR